MAIELEMKSPNRNEKGVIFSNFPLNDHPDEDLIPVLKKAVDYIEETRLNQINSVILVHCKAGKSRSAATVIAYFILKLGKTYDEAFGIVKSARPQIDPNIGFIAVLMDLKRNDDGLDEKLNDLKI